MLALDEVHVEDGDGSVLSRGHGAALVQRGVVAATQKPAAIKTLDLFSRHPWEIEKLYDRLLRDRRVLTRGGSCAQIVQWLAVFRRETDIIIVAELVDWGSLDQLKQLLLRTMPLSHLACVAAQVLRGLQYLHGHGVAHGAVEPPHILLSSEGEAKLTCSPCARSTIQEDWTMISVGPFYVTPEMFENEKLGPPGDVFCLGIVVYEMATGVHPWQCNNIPSLAWQLQTAAMPRLSALAHPPELCDFVAKCLQRRTAERPSAMSLVAHGFVDGGLGGQEGLCRWLALAHGQLVVSLHSTESDQGLTRLSCVSMGGNELLSILVDPHQKTWGEVRQEVCEALTLFSSTRLTLLLPSGREVQSDEGAVLVADLLECA
mmetsp:Transcript_27211/g.84687  ORF Transcript_27211/g.84687 Transcript_27211/m.84687 type:complete len:374 (-) Transcript_27211:50-1171(-)